MSWESSVLMKEQASPSWKEALLVVTVPSSCGYKSAQALVGCFLAKWWKKLTSPLGLQALGPASMETLL